MLLPPDTAKAHQDRSFADLSDAVLDEELTRAAFHGDHDEWLLQLLLLERVTRRTLRTRPAKGRENARMSRTAYESVRRVAEK